MNKLHSKIYSNRKVIINYKILQSITFFSVFLIKYAALVSIRDFFQKH